MKREKGSVRNTMPTLDELYVDLAMLSRALKALGAILYKAEPDELLDIDEQSGGLGTLLVELACELDTLAADISEHALLRS